LYNIKDYGDDEDDDNDDDNDDDDDDFFSFTYCTTVSQICVV